MLALVVLIIACFWGWTHKTHAQTPLDQSQLENYDVRKPGPVVTVLFIGSIFLGLLIVAASIFIEYERVKALEREAIAESLASETPIDQQSNIM